jgi:RNA-splicing ligase RtcB
MITGKDLIAWGYTPGPWFKPAIERANELVHEGMEIDQIQSTLSLYAPEPPVYIPRRAFGELGYFCNMDNPGGDEVMSDDEVTNWDAVHIHMHQLMRVPTIKAGAVMPDACPAGSAPGTIPVGGVVACENAIHPGFHSADVCCSMAITVFGPSTTPKVILDAGMKLTHFGPGGRHDDLFRLPDGLRARILANPITAPLIEHAERHMGTQGDGNHFYYAGTQKSSGRTALVTHHGSRGFGARVYKAGMRIAEAMTKKIAPSVPKHQAWIVADSQEGQDYWEALQICRAWTKVNHFSIHTIVAGYTHSFMDDRFWNEHNFVFQKPDGLFYHAKGATPAYPGFSVDTNGLTLIPMNMAEPILIARGLNADHGLGFAPHGAGRNLSRTGYLKSLGDEVPTTTVDARWFSGKQDLSELPGAYKNAESVRRQIKSFGLAEIVDEVLPYGCIMAGEIDWRRAGKELGDAA